MWDLWLTHWLQRLVSTVTGFQCVLQTRFWWRLWWFGGLDGHVGLDWFLAMCALCQELWLELCDMYTVLPTPAPPGTGQGLCVGLLINVLRVKGILSLPARMFLKGLGMRVFFESFVWWPFGNFEVKKKETLLYFLPGGINLKTVEEIKYKHMKYLFLATHYKFQNAIKSPIYISKKS